MSSKKIKPMKSGIKSTLKAGIKSTLGLGMKPGVASAFSKKQLGGAKKG